MAFHKIDWDQWERAEYFRYYKDCIKTHYNLTLRLDVTALRRELDKRGLKFYPAFVWAVMKAVNIHREFRMAVDGEGNLGWYDECHPGYTVLHRDTGTFSDLWSEYSPSFRTFYGNMTGDMEKYGQVHRLKGKPGCPPNFCSLSCVPWLDFTGYGCDTYGDSDMYFPVILFGRYRQEGQVLTLPFNIWVHHAVADGWHIHLLVDTLQQLLAEPENWLDS